MLSVIIITKNEALNIRRCLESIQWADEIIVLDSGSTDKTKEIALEYTEHVYEADWPGYGIQKNRALSKATQPWVLNLDADESIDPDLKTAITEAIKTDKAEAFRIPIRLYFYGKDMRYSGSPSRHIRLFKREGARYSEDIVHEKVILPGKSKLGQLIQPIRHHSYQDLSHAIYKMNRYSSYTAKIRIEQKKQAGLIKTCIGTAWMFFRCFILQRGFLDGQAGFILALLKAQGTFFRGLKQLYPDRAMQHLPKVENKT